VAIRPERRSRFDRDRVGSVLRLLDKIAWLGIDR
jgi:hypothetical protein